MPPFTAIALDRLIEPGASKSMTTAKNVPDSKPERRNYTPTTRIERGLNATNQKLDRRNSEPKTTIDKKHHWAQISPALYATPESTPVPDSPTSFPPSPYIINHKRRGPRLLKSYSDNDVAACKRASVEEKVDENAKNGEKATIDNTRDVVFNVAVPSPAEVEHLVGSGDGELGNNNSSCSLAEKCISALHHEPMNSVAFSSEESGELDNFFEPQDSMSAKSNNDGESNGELEKSLLLPGPMLEFFDAWEELSSESGVQPPPRDVEAELREMRLTLLMEVEKRKQAEEALDNMWTQWMKIRQELSLVGLALPADPIAAEAEQQGVDNVEELCRQLYIARFVSNSIGRGTAKAEVEMEMEAEIESKNFEIARLSDRLHYYETVNQEMSQRNQEAVEMARRLRLRRKRRQRWVWGSVTAAITLGTGALMWSYFSTGRGSSSTDEAITPDHDTGAK